MNYDETLEYLFNQHPAFQRVGAQAYKEGLDTSLALDEIYDHPHTHYKCIHVAGTNGKGSVSHTIASILQKCGYTVGLYTSPHLVDFRERIRVNGEMISKTEVIDFVEDYKSRNFNGAPSFFELTMMMAFDYFRKKKVDFAVVEVGLGGRLDSTNIISPILGVITNISFDHTQFLGNTLASIAREKAGIMKKNIPVVIGEADGDVRSVFESNAEKVGAPIVFSNDCAEILSHRANNEYVEYQTRTYGVIESELTGACQCHNANTILHAVTEMRKIGLLIPDQAVAEGFKNVCEISGLMGRWMKLQKNPLVICDTGHNVGGIGYIVNQLNGIKCDALRIVIGFVNDKDIEHILQMLPKKAVYYFTQAQIPRAQSAEVVKEMASKYGLIGSAYPKVSQAYDAALNDAYASDFIFVGGSTFVVADLLSSLSSQE
ncbi:MAG: bifunctional folylpolyglutamate synthase/dihydrofolate synthase [Bacteroidales bacterium]|nr:bifunctional folylpolyglutamate synthase/dihydrofolate synthase [Bacteroidales bacterium]